MRGASTMWSIAITATRRGSAGRSPVWVKWKEDPGQPPLGPYGGDERALVGRAAVLGWGVVSSVRAGHTRGVHPVRGSDQLPGRGRHRQPMSEVGTPGPKR